MKRLTRTAKTAKPGRRGKTPPDRNGNTEQQILDGAHTVFLRHGTSGARMQDIAAEAGVNQALLHYYFRSKERLSEAVFRRAAAQLLPRVIEVMASAAALEDKIARVVEIELDYLLSAPYLPGYIISELHNHPERVRQLLSAVTGMTPEHVGPRVVTRLRRQLEEGVKEGRFRPIPPDQLIVNLFSLCIFPFAARPMLMAILGMDQPGFERFIAQRRGQLADFVLGALRP
jgi:AcrR family transcriptional regulator